MEVVGDTVKFMGNTVRIECEACGETREPLEKLLDILSKLEKKVSKYPDIAEKVRSIGRFRIKIAGDYPKDGFSYHHWLSGTVASVSHGSKYIRLNTIAEDVVLAQILFLALRDKPDYEIYRIASKILGGKPLEDEILEKHVFAVDTAEALARGTVYMIPREELGRLKRKRRGTTMAVTEEGEVIWLSKKDKDNYWAFMFLVSDYLSPEAKEKARLRIIEAEARYIYKTDYGVKKEHVGAYK